MTQERLIELIEELSAGWEMNVNERAGPNEYSKCDRIRVEVEALLAALKDRRITIQVAA